MQLRSPDYGNTVTLDTGVVNARSQDGDLIQIYHSSWPHEDSFSVEFSGLSEEIKLQLEAFYVDNIGQEIEFTDHETRRWLGFLTSKITFKQTGPDCLFTAAFSFLGVLQ